MQSHKPEVIMNNFNTALGQRVGRMLGSLFHQEVCYSSVFFLVTLPPLFYLSSCFASPTTCFSHLVTTFLQPNFKGRRVCIFHN
jgi:hypothetical protein